MDAHELAESVSGWGELFRRLEPACFALFTEAILLPRRIGRPAGLESGLLWAAVRTVERGEAQCPSLSDLSSESVEHVCQEHLIPFDRGASQVAWEEWHDANPPGVLIHMQTCFGGGCATTASVAAGELLAACIAIFGFAGVPGLLFRSSNLDVREAHASLLGARGFEPTETLIARGSLPAGSQDLYRKACERAWSVGSWLLRDVHVAAVRAGKSQEVCRTGGAREEGRPPVGRGGAAEQGGAWRFSGPRPWAPSACPALGVEPPAPG